MFQEVKAGVSEPVQGVHEVKIFEAETSVETVQEYYFMIGYCRWILVQIVP